MQRTSQLESLEELKQPIRTSSTFFGAVLAAYIAAQRADARAFIINEMYQKEYAAYDIFHHSFEPSSLPSGVSTDWVQYYHYTPGPIKIILQGQNVSDGLTFASPPDEIDRQLNDLLTAPKPTPEQIAAVEKKRVDAKRNAKVGLFIASGVVAAYVILVLVANLT